MMDTDVDKKKDEKPSDYILCKPCYQKEQYPKEDAVEAQQINDPAQDSSCEVKAQPEKKLHFEECSLTKEYWDKVGKDLKVQNDNPTQVNKACSLSGLDQQKLL